MTLSVIVPVYNVAPYLRRCLESVAIAVARCPHVGIEVVCVDDGSADGSGEILDTFAAANPQFVVLHQASNRGVSAARNAALARATGDWVAFVDADDGVAEDWFDSALQVIGESPTADVVNFRSFAVVRSPDDLRKAAAKALRTKARIVRVFKGPAAREEALQTYARNGWPFRNFVRRASLAGLSFREGVRIKEDVLFFLELALRVKNFVLADYPGYFYTRRDGSALMRYREEGDCVSFGEALLSLGRQHDDEDLWRAMTVALGYDFVQWADERDPASPYDPSRCGIRDVWRALLEEGDDRLSEMHVWWRVAIRHWLKTGDIVWARRIRRMREWTARFI